MTTSGGQRTLRSRSSFDDPGNVDMIAPYLERHLHFGFSLEELQSPDRPAVGTAQTGSDMSPGRARPTHQPSRGR